MWNDLSPVASECLWFRVNLLSLEMRENTPSDSECDQSCEYPRWGAEQQGHSSVIPKCCGESGEERDKGEGSNDAGYTSCGG